MISIGELSRRTNVKVPTIRYYESIGLMPDPGRTEGGQRRYGQDELERLAFIRAGQAAMDAKWPAGNGAKWACFALAWGATRCNYGPCVASRDHTGPTEDQKKFAREFAQRQKFAADHATWQAQNPRP